MPIAHSKYVHKFRTLVIARHLSATIHAKLRGVRVADATAVQTKHFIYRVSLGAYPARRWFVPVP